MERIIICPIRVSVFQKKIPHVPEHEISTSVTCCQIKIEENRSLGFPFYLIKKALKINFSQFVTNFYPVYFKI